VLQWVQENGVYIQLFQIVVQILFWIVIAVVSVYALLLFKRLVDARVAFLRAGLPETPVEAEAAVSVDEFVD